MLDELIGGQSKLDAEGRREQAIKAVRVREARRKGD